MSDTLERRAELMLEVATIYLEPGVEAYARGREILARYPEAERIVVPSHWNIPGLHGNEGLAEEWTRIKRTVLVLGVKKGLKIEPYTRSSDFVAPSQANGCAMACAYCVASGTMIATPSGPVPVEQLRGGDEVHAYDETGEGLIVAPIAAVSSREVDELLEVQVGSLVVDGPAVDDPLASSPFAVLRLTDEHPLLTERGWVRAGELRNDDRIYCFDSRLLLLPIVGIERVPGRAVVHNFHVPGPETYIANGLITHNCYVPRRKGFANPITTFVNIEQILNTIERHAAKQGMKLEPTPADPWLWVYELGTNSDGGVDALVSDNVRDMVALFRRLPNAKGTFSTKFVNRELLDYDPQGKTRLRISLMPAHVSRVVDVRTSPIDERIAAINEFANAGYEVNVNFAPVIYTSTWREDYSALFEQLNDTLSEQVKRQLVAEIIFLTHNEAMHEVNMRWHPRGEELLWQPEIQEHKRSETGGDNLRYRRGFKGRLVGEFRALLAEKMPYCAQRYAF